MTLHDIETLERIGNQLQVSERLAALGRVTAGVAHEVKNPLNSMRFGSKFSRPTCPSIPSRSKPSRCSIAKSIGLDRAVKTFLNFTKPVEINLEETDLRALSKKCWTRRAPRSPKPGSSWKLDAPENFPPVLSGPAADPSMSAEPASERVQLHSRRAAASPSAWSAKAISRPSPFPTPGKGISPEDRSKIFQLFFTTRPGGSGIGLANTFRFVQLHNGRIEFESEVGRGTTFRVELPLGRMEAVPAGQPANLRNLLRQRKVKCPAVIKRQTVTAGMPGGGLYSPAASAFPRRAARSSMFMRRRLSPRPPFRHPRRPSAP